MAEFKLGRIKFVWKDSWTTGTEYYKDDIVSYGGKTYICVIGHNSNADFYADLENIPARWNQFSDGQDWKGNWAPTTLYKENDIVKYGGYVYICNNGHTSSSTLEDNQGNWDLFAESFDWKGTWTSGTIYKVNDLVKYGGYVYICNTAHTAAATNTLGLEANQNDWDIFSKGIEWKGEWTTSTRYKVGDLIKNGGTTYVCNQGHTSAATESLGLEVDQGKWDYFNQGIDYKGVWNNAVRYKNNDVVKYGGGLWICITPHTSTSSFVSDNANWNQFVEGIEFEGDWLTATTYQPGDIVRYGGNTYIVKVALVSSNPPPQEAASYDLFTTGFRLQGDWSSLTAYRVGEVIRLKGFTYVAVADNTNQTPPNPTYWAKLNEGIDWNGNWGSAQVYSLGDAVKYGPNSYICVLGHTSTNGVDRPDNDITGTYWNLLTAGNEESVLTTIGDLVYYSGSGPTRLPIGEEGQVLTVDAGLPTWKFFGKVKNVFYVAPGGINEPSPIRGSTVDKPWGSVRYACEQIEAGTEFPNAGYLLRYNRTFIQKEIVEWVDYQITNNIGIFSGFSNDNEALCERDMGLILDAITYDLTHTGNVKTREATESYFNTAGTALIAAIADEDDQLVAAINYGVSLIQSVLANTAPAQNYQALNGVSVGDRIKQIIDVDYTAESGADDICVGLAAIITDAVTAGNTSGMPNEDIPNYTINVKTGLFEEVLPIRVPANTAIVGDELRSARVSPAGKLIASADKAKSLATLAHLRTITDDVIQNISVTPTTGNTATQDTTSQKAGDIGSTTALNSVIANAAEIKDIITNNTPDAYVYPAPTNWGTTLTDTAYAATGYLTGDTSGFDDGRRLLLANKAFLQDEVSEWILAQIAGDVAPFVGFTYTGTRRTKCERDVGLIVDAIVYDMTYGGNLATQIAARSYYSLGAFVEPAEEKAPALAVQLRIKDIIDNIITGNTAGWTKTTALSQDVSGTPGSADAGAFAQDRIQDIYDTINTGTEPTTIAPYTAWVATALQTARAAINNAKAEIQSDGVQFVKRRFPTLAFDEALCSRDVGYIVDALGYDLMFGSNFLSIQNGLSYRRGTVSTLVVLTEQLDAQQAIVDFIGLKVSEIAASGAVVFADLLWSYIIGIVTAEALPVNTGRNTPTTNLDMINGANILRLNADFFAAEATAYANDTFKTAVSSADGGTDTFSCTSQTWMVAGDTVRFSGTTFGGINTTTTYYVLSDGLTATTFKVSLTPGGTAVDLSAGSGTMTVTWYYAADRCQNDVRSYINAIADDMIYTGNYNVTFASRYYLRALRGSKLEDMYYVRNGCGIRNMTVLGLDGTSDGDTPGINPTGLSVPNEYGTRRPLAGAYVSLDPGWGPNDRKVWVTTRSTYVQNVTTFGTGATGQKIDGSLHAGGNDSIVSNDFTQVISNGIGAWITNLGRAELVSVFSYYAHIGYLAENGGRIRATNGNNSYGDFGSVSEGIDVTEVAITGKINNRSTEANVRNVITNGDDILIYEFGNAGNEYSQASFLTSGAGSAATTVANEFRDGAVFNVRLTDPGDSSGTGGTGYITASNLAQAGNTTQITLAAADTSSSSAYVGMSIYIISGTGAGQYGYINTYNAGSKVATILKESTGTAGWDHVVAGTTIAPALDVTTSYQITPRLQFTAPPFTKTVADLPAVRNWTDVIYGDGFASYSGLSATGGAGSLSTFDVVRRNGVYSVTINVPGVLYVAGNTLTIAGTSLGGTSPANDLTITVDTVNSPSGSISSVTASGTAVTAKYVAIASGTTSGAYSLDGISWTTMTMPSAVSSGGGELNDQWSAISYGVVNNISYYVAVARATSTAAYSLDGINWTAANLNEVADWCDIAYGNGSFVAIAESDSSSAFRAVSTNGGSTWATTSLGSGAKAIAYGSTRFVVVEGNFSNSVAYSATGVAWTVTTLPANDDSTESNWVDIAYGNNRYVAISDSSAMAAYSFDGATWFKSNLPGIFEWSSINYGQGVFYVTTRGDRVATSPDGVTWTLRDGSTASLNVTATSKDTISAAYLETSTLTSGTWSDVVYDGTQFLAVGYSGAAGLYATSTDGTSWTNGTLPTVNSTFEYTAVAYNDTNQYVALIGGSGGTRNIAYSSDGTSWTGQLNALTANGFWKDLIWAGDRYIALRGDSASINYSTNGTSWTNAAVTGGSSEMSAAAYGVIGATNYIVTVAGYSTGSQTSSYSTNGGVSWTSGSTLPSSDFWADIAFGNGTFVTVAGGTGSTSTKAAYSTNGTTWTAATLPGTATRWNKVVYGGNGFTAFAYNSNRTAYSEDGITWVEGPAQAATRNWNTAAHGGTKLVSLATGTTIGSYADFVLNTNYLTTSSTTDLRIGDRLRFTGDTFGNIISGSTYYVTAVVNSTQFSVSLTNGGSNFVLSTGSGTSPFLAGRDFVHSTLGNPGGIPRWVVLAEGSGSVQNIRQGATARARAYVTDEKIAEIWIQEPGSGYVTAPSLTITDPNNIGADATVQIRIGNGVIAQPTFTNRGNNYTAATAEITGNGYADNYQTSTFVAFKDLTDVPKPGSNVQIAGIDDVWYRLVNVTNLLLGPDGTYTATLQLSPGLGAAETPEHETATIIRRRYSQVRLTGHDLLDIGTGDFVNTNYPGLPLSDPIPAQEYRQSNGGRVFYTSTDQDGNFRVGGLFNVEQSTGVATLNADAFNIAGLNELSLGSVALGGSGATISEFSTDPFFTQDSDSVVPTQRAIKAYITSQIGGGGSSLNVNTLTAGVVFIAGQTIATTTNVQLNINTKVNFKGGIVGDALVLNYFLLNN